MAAPTDFARALAEGRALAGKADMASLTAFEIGLFGWMALMYFVLEGAGICAAARVAAALDEAGDYHLAR